MPEIKLIDKSELFISPSALERILYEFKGLAEKYIDAGMKKFTIVSKPTTSDGKHSITLKWSPSYDQEGNITNL